MQRPSVEHGLLEVAGAATPRTSWTSAVVLVGRVGQHGVDEVLYHGIRKGPVCVAVVVVLSDRFSGVGIVVVTAGGRRSTSVMLTLLLLRGAVVTFPSVLFFVKLVQVK